MNETARTVQKIDPLTGEARGAWRAASDAEVHAAVARARAAAPGWAARSLADRLRVLQQLGPLLRDEGEAMAARITADTGKPLLEAMVTELLTIPVAVAYYAKHAERMLGRRRVPTPVVFQPRTSYVEYAPMGVIAVIAPWNFPFQLAVLPTLSALIAGNTVVLKPSEVTPGVGALIAEMFERIGLPPGVVEVVQGDGATGAALTRGDVDKIFFTGSVATGRKVMAAAAERLIPVELELGGKDAMIVCHDAPVERAARAAVWGGFMNAGQMCISVERLFVVDAIYDEVLERVEHHLDRIRVGAPDEDADMGPLVFAPQLEVVARHLADARERGATIRRGGKRLERPGHFIAPTLVTDVTPEMDIYREETFGPVLPVIRVCDEHEALRMANDHVYGLTGSVWTRDAARGLELASQLACGQAMVNDVVTAVGNIALPFGGIRHSGMGRYHGAEGLRTFCHQKSIMVSRGLLPAEPFWFPYASKLPDVRELYRRLADGDLPRAALPFTRLLRRSRDGGST